MDEFRAIINRNYDADDIVINVNSLEEMWIMFVGLLAADETLGIDVCRMAMATLPWASEAGFAFSPQHVFDWIHEHSEAGANDNEHWDRLSEAIKVGAQALRTWLREHQIPHLAHYLPTPWDQWVFLCWRGCK